jgi:hypothetical protein
VRLVHNEPSRIRSTEGIELLSRYDRRVKSLGRTEKEAKHPPLEKFVAFLLLRRREVAVDEGAGNLLSLEIRDLLAHQGLERRDDVRRAAFQKDRHLKTERLPRTRRADEQHRLAAQGGQYHIQLSGPQSCNPEESQHDLEGLVQAADFAASIEDVGELRGPADDRSSRQPDLQIRMVCGVTRGTQRYEIAWIVLTAGRARDQVMDMRFGTTASVAAPDAAVPVALENGRADG